MGKDKSEEGLKDEKAVKMEMIDYWEAITSIIFAVPRCSDLPGLLQIQCLFTAKYGKEFISAAAELKPGTIVNRTIIEKLSVKAPSAEVKLSLLIEIAQKYNLHWDPSNAIAEFSKKHESSGMIAWKAWKSWSNGIEVESSEYLAVFFVVLACCCLQLEEVVLAEDDEVDCAVNETEMQLRMMQDNELWSGNCRCYGGAAMKKIREIDTEIGKI
ncbi:hypothetical protein C5167_037283 [Papaver somniferum]|uniref:Uncharacterized protein n=1 Tax=Papaver somniferum TaxID=3469 RepID=A0A4Y7IAA1_PAPSO|nr:hypothetical protein C5167_037283 [Papaver somniferum]